MLFSCLFFFYLLELESSKQWETHLKDKLENFQSEVKSKKKKKLTKIK